jgi:hypothetical protein
MLNELLRRRALDVMDRIMSHPSTIPFHSVSPPDSNSPDPPADLQTIHSRLQQNKYSKLQTWLSDVEECWTGAERRAALNPSEYAQRQVVLAVANRRIFEKEKRAIDILSAHNWGTELVRLRGRLTDLMFDPPPKIKTFASPFTKGRIPKPTAPPISERELHQFVAAAGMLDQEEESDEMLRIISELQPDLQSDELSFDVSKFSPRTLAALRAYVKARLQKRGLKYPEEKERSSC